MANQEHLDILRQGKKAWNQWRKEHADIQPDLSGAKLRDANLVWANLSRVNLSGASLVGADLKLADLSDANLRGANLYGADLTRAWLHRTDLTDANLNGVLLGPVLRKMPCSRKVDKCGTVFA
ncbi:hypothetical protein KSF_049550 [Reticulibacter mediterranei]|uniref:Pentapeptide repeat-containing protein n=1 Tax=Reticulibacter mediterranei TaxID=2778369 RepID=A0A8J3N586_9CHLR|nr:pentapeptide repeat-containing protein [Reticulibacter mediterranei]GHO94907.1 hypothetical protein KSF_049550 [Reticulibacter mediterranei]